MPPGTVSKAGFQDFRIRVGTYSFWRTVARGARNDAEPVRAADFSPTDDLEIHGNSSASQVYYAAITPGAVLEEGVLAVVNGKFVYEFDPQKMADRIKTYDIANLVNGNRR